MLSANGVPLVRSTQLEITAPDRSKLYYMSSWIEQPKYVAADGSTVLLIGSEKGEIYGSMSLKIMEGEREKSALLTVRFIWRGAKPAVYRLTAAKMWLEPFLNGALSLDGNSAPILSTDAAFREGNAFRWDMPFASFSAESADTAWRLYQNAPNFDKWTADTDTQSLALLDMPLEPNQSVEHSILFKIAPKSLPQMAEKSVLLATDLLALVQTPNTERLPILPQPKLMQLNDAKPVRVLQGDGNFKNEMERLFAETMARRWQMPVHRYQNMYRVLDKSLASDEAYRLEIQEDGRINIGFSADAGMRNAVQTLAQMVYAKDGNLVVSSGLIEDAPSISWRGIHSLVGPDAFSFHKRMFEQVLLPLKMNQIIFQCEQTDWPSQPKIKNPITMPISELQKEFAWIRAQGIEPIPLIQSFGHAEWLFANGQNADIAMSPDVAYAFDPRKPKAQAIIHGIWEDAIRALKPKTIHFGLDEVNMIGFPDDPDLVTNLWRSHMTFLSKIATDHHVGMMLWGDIGLAPKEAIDATNGFSAEHARLRREAIPIGATITDWHYAANPDPQVFRKSLQIWKQNGNTPIAASWFNATNIRSFTQAAIDENIGVLQTTWSGYESNETNMLKNIVQYGAYITALDYAWSGRKEMPKDLPYDPIEMWRKFYFRTPEPFRPVAGFTTLTDYQTEAITVGGVRFKRFKDAIMSSLLETNESPFIHKLTFTVNKKGNKIAFLFNTAYKLEQDEPVASVQITFTDGSKQDLILRYGRHIHALSDPSPPFMGESENGLSRFILDLGNTKTIQNVMIQQANLYAGIEILGLTVLQN